LDGSSFLTGTKQVARIIAIANVKGGVGKTTTTENLAAALTERGRNVLTVDMDPQASLTLSLGCKLAQLHKTISDALSPAAVPVSSLIVPTNEKYSLVPATHELYDIERELQHGKIRILALRNALEPLRAAYDYILLDCPANAGILTGNALAAADEVIIPFPADYLAYQALGWFIQVIKRIQTQVNPDLRVAGLFIAMYDPRHRHVREVMRDVQASFGIDVPFFTAAVRHSVIVKQAARAEQSVLRYAPQTPAAEAYRLLAQEVEDGICVGSADDAYAEIRRGREALAGQDLETAHVAFHKATLLAPQLPEAWVGRAQSAHEWEERVRALAQAYTLDPDAPEVKQGFESALSGELAQQGIDEIPNLMSVAHFLVQVELLAYAHKVFKRVSELDAAHEEAWLGQARTSEDLMERLACLQRALEANPENAETRREMDRVRERMKAKAFALVENAESTARQGETAKAHTLFEQALELDSKNERAWLGLARTSDDPRAALRYVERVLQINPENVQARELYGWLFEPMPARFQITPLRVVSILLAIAVILLLALYLRGNLF
jgi:chromosome partitioning protein